MLTDVLLKLNQAKLSASIVNLFTNNLETKILTSCKNKKIITPGKSCWFQHEERYVVVEDFDE